MGDKIIKVTKNPYVFSVLSKICIVFLGFGYTVCQSRYLGPSLKGDVAYISSITQMTSIIFGLGIHQAYPYYKKKTGRDVAPFFIKLTIVMTFLYFLIAIILTGTIRGDFKLAAIFMMTPLLVYNRIAAYINMVEAPNRKNVTELMADLFLLIVTVLLWVFVAENIFWGVFLLIIKDAVLAIIYTYRLRGAIASSSGLGYREAGGVLKYGIFPMLTLLMTTLNYRVDIIMLNNLATSAEVGVYSVGVMLAERVWLIPDALKEVMISNLAKGKGIDEVTYVIRMCNTACIFVVLGIAAFGRPFIHFFFGQEYAGAYSVTITILAGVVFMVYYKIIGAFNIVEGKQKENLGYLVVSVICNMILNASFIPVFGNLGAAIASIFSYAVSAGLFIRKFTRETPARLGDMVFLNGRDINRMIEIIKR